MAQPIANIVPGVSMTHTYIPRIEQRQRNLFKEEYFSSTDTKIYIDNEDQTEVAYISYILQEQLLPLYGYASRTYDDVAVGNRIISGNMKVAIKNTEESSSWESALEKIGNWDSENITQYNERQKEIMDEVEWLNTPEEEASVQPIEVSYIEEDTPSERTRKWQEENYYRDDILRLTNYEKQQISYDSTQPLHTYDFIKDVCIYLRKLGLYNGEDTYNYDYQVANAITQFKISMDLDPSDTLDTNTLAALRHKADTVANDVIEGDEEEDVDTSDNSDFDTRSAHYDPYFNSTNEKTFRQSGTDIKIVLGDGTIVKTIRDVHMRGVSVEVDTSGNPISELYEFIARDVTESDEPMDADKYIPGDNKDKAPSDFKYDFGGYTK